MIGISLLNADFTKIGNIVKDNHTKLEWQDDTLVVSMQWEEAITYCETLTLDGYTDWRLPNINELKSIVDKSRINPAIAIDFKNTDPFMYWSSTSYVDDKSYSLTVYFKNGYLLRDTKEGYNGIKCVRDAQ